MPCIVDKPLKGGRRMQITYECRTPRIAWGTMAAQFPTGGRGGVVVERHPFRGTVAQKVFHEADPDGVCVYLTFPDFIPEHFLGAGRKLQ